MKFQISILLIASLTVAAPLAQTPASADQARASSILSGLADGLKASSFPMTEGVSSILSGLASGLGQSSRTSVVDLSTIATSTIPKRQDRPARPPPTTADMERASGILKGLADGLKGVFPGSDGIASILQGLGGGIGNGAKSTTTRAVEIEKLEKRQGIAMPAPGTPEAHKSASEITNGLAKGIKGSGLPLSDNVSGLLSGVASSAAAGGVQG